MKTKKQKESLEWAAPEFDYYPKNKTWFLAAGGLTGLVFLWAVFTQNFLFALLIGLAYFSLSAYALKKPRHVNLSISGKGVKIDQNIHEFENLKSFWVFYDPPAFKEISLHSKRTLTPYIKIPLGEQNPVEARAILVKYLPEIEQEASTIETISKNLRF